MSMVSQDGGGKLQILYVDDEKFLHEPFKLYMEMIGSVSVDCANSGKEAIDKLSSLMYHAVVSDYQMPGMDGIELLKNIRSRGSDIPFVIFTARGREEIVIEAINNGADYYLMKGADPISLFADMLHVIQSAVNEREEREHLRVTEERLRAVLDNTHDAIVLFDMNYRVLYVNPSFQKTFGWSLEDLNELSLPWIPEESLPRTETRIDDMVSSKKALHYDGIRKTKQGRLIKCHISITPITDPNGKVNTVSAIMTPIEQGTELQS